MQETDRSFARRILIALVLVGTAALVCYTANLILLGFAGVLGAILLDAAVEFVCRETGLRRGVSYAIVLIGIITAIGAGSYLVVPRLVLQLTQLGAAIPEGIRNAQKWLNETVAGRVIAAHSGSLFSSAAGQVSRFGLAGVDAAVRIGIALVVSAYLAAAPADYQRGVLRLIPPDRRKRTDLLLREVARTMGWWMAGQLVPMIALGVVTLIGLLLIGVPLAFTLSIFTGLMIFIPFVGAVIAFVITTLVTISSDPTKAPLVGVVFIVVHILEGYILTPLVQRRAVRLPPPLTILSQVLMTTLFGFLGLVLATPLAAGSLVLIRRMYLEEPATEAPVARMSGR